MVGGSGDGVDVGVNSMTLDDKLKNKSLENLKTFERAMELIRKYSPPKNYDPQPEAKWEY